MPSISVEGEVSALAADAEIVESLEQCVINWLGQITMAVEGQLRKTPQVPRAALSESPPEEELCVRGAQWSSLSSPCFGTSLEDGSKHPPGVRGLSAVSVLPGCFLD